MAIAWLVATAVCLSGQVTEHAAPAPADASKTEALEVSSARAQLQLAEANLRRVQQLNERLSRTVPASVVAEYQRDLEIAKTQMQQAESRSAESAFAVWLRRAESIWRDADTIWKNALKVNQRAPGTFEALDVERFRLRAEVTRLQLERGRLLAGAAHESQLQWQVEVVNNEVQRLKEDSRAAPFARYWRTWW